MEELIKRNIVEALNNHGVIAFPTETVMGLGVYFDDKIAFEKLNKVKGRPEKKPYTLMLAKKENIRDFAYLNDRDIAIIDRFMPGPITLLLRAKSGLPNWVDLNTGIIGIRVPDYSQTLDILKAAQKPLLVPSANKSGEKPANTFKEVQYIFDKEIDYVVEADAGLQKPSTIVDLTGKDIKIIREGPITLDDIIDSLGGTL